MNKIIKKIMIDRDLTIVKLAQMLNVTANYLSLVIHGHHPGYPLREKISRVLDIPYETLWMPDRAEGKNKNAPTVKPSKVR